MRSRNRSRRSLVSDISSAVITGPTGVVGTSLISELVESGVEVYAVCRPGTGRAGRIPRHPLVHIVWCSLQEISRLPELIGGHVDAFFHLAWDGTFGPARQDWMRQVNNVSHTLSAVYAAQELGCSVFVGAGSQSEFGHVDGLLSPDLPCNPDNGYGASKLAASVMSRALCLHLGIRHIWCRIVSLYGPLDSDHSLVMSCIRELEETGHFACTAGEQVWDYLYSADAARALHLAALKGRPGAIYVIGSGKTCRLREFISAIRDAVNPSATLGFGEVSYYPNQVMHLEADISTLTRDTGFVPAWSFEDGIAKTVNWYERECLRKDR